MKDSNIPWIGAIPDHWNVINTSALFHEHKLKNKGLVCTNLLSLSYGIIKRKDINATGGLLPESFDAYNIISPGDIVLRLTDLQNDHRSLRTGLCTEQGIITSAYLALRKNVNINERYYHYLFHAYDICKVYYGMGDGVRQGMGWDDIKTLPVLMAPLEEQRRIADFLDQRCAEIDNILAKNRASIDEYRKFKQSIITEAIFKGVRGKRPMKDSGIAWIGQIPKEWQIKPLKACLFERLEKNDPVISKERLSLSIDLGVTLYSEKKTNLDRYKDDFSQYKLAHKGDLVLNSMNMIVGAVGISNYFGCVSPAYYTYYDNETDHIVTHFFHYLFHTKTIMRVLYSMGKGIYAIEREDDRVNTCRLKVSREDLRAMKFPFPPIDEQREIVSFLHEKCSRIDSLISSKERFVKELEAYRKSLIFECVTGKKEATV